MRLQVQPPGAVPLARAARDGGVADGAEGRGAEPVPDGIAARPRRAAPAANDARHPGPVRGSEVGGSSRRRRGRRRCPCCPCCRRRRHFGRWRSGHAPRGHAPGSRHGPHPGLEQPRSVPARERRPRRRHGRQAGRLRRRGQEVARAGGAAAHAAAPVVLRGAHRTSARRAPGRAKVPRGRHSQARRRGDQSLARARRAAPPPHPARHLRAAPGRRRPHRHLRRAPRPHQRAHEALLDRPG